MILTTSSFYEILAKFLWEFFYIPLTGPLRSQQHATNATGWTGEGDVEFSILNPNRELLPIQRFGDLREDAV
jgi:hypothetical protein